MIEKLKELFSKENPNRNLYIAVLAIMVIVGFNAYTRFEKKSTVKITGNPQTPSSEQTVVSSELLKKKLEKEKKKELAKTGIEFTNIENKTETQSVISDRGFYSQDELTELKKEIQELKKEIEIKKEIEKQGEEEMSVAGSNGQKLQVQVANLIGQPVSYPQTKEQKAEPELTKKTIIPTPKNFTVSEEGTVLDDIKLPEGYSSFVRIKVKEGTLVVKATATILGIKFSNQGILNGKSVSVQVSDDSGYPFIYTYVVSKKGKRVSKLAFLSFLKGLAEGFANFAGKSILIPTGSSLETVRVISDTGKYAVAKGVASGVDVLTQEEKEKVKAMLDYYVLLAGTKVKVLILGGEK